MKNGAQGWRGSGKGEGVSDWEAVFLSAQSLSRNPTSPVPACCPLPRATQLRVKELEAPQTWMLLKGKSFLRSAFHPDLRGLQQAFCMSCFSGCCELIT